MLLLVMVYSWSKFKLQLHRPILVSAAPGCIHSRPAICMFVVVMKLPMGEVASATIGKPEPDVLRGDIGQLYRRF
jgi:hypothetical protein